MDLVIGTFLYCLVGLYFYYKREKFQRIESFIYLAIFLRYLAALYHWYFGPFPVLGSFPDSGNDEYFFLDSARDFSVSNILEVSNFTSISFYSSSLGIIFNIFGEAKIVASALNSFLGVITFINVYLISGLIWGRRSSRKAAILFLLIPMQIVYSVIVLREAMFTCFATTGILYFMIWYFKSNKMKILFKSIGFLLLAVNLHDAFVIIIPILVGFIMFRKGYDLIDGRVLAVGGIFVVIAFGGVINYSVKNFSDEDFRLDYLSERRGIERERDRAFSYIANTDNAFSIMLSGVTRPFFWEYQVGYLRIVNTLIIYLFIFIGISRRSVIKRNTRALMLLVVIIPLMLVYAFGSSDLGQSDRHRSKVIPLIIAVIPFRGRII